MTKPDDPKSNHNMGRLPKHPVDYLKRVCAVLQSRYGVDCAILGCTITEGSNTETVFTPGVTTFGNVYAQMRFSDEMSGTLSGMFSVEEVDDGPDDDDDDDDAGGDSDDAEETTAE